MMKGRKSCGGSRCTEGSEEEEGPALAPPRRASREEMTMGLFHLHR
jgi:hypothetical protein